MSRIAVQETLARLKRSQGIPVLRGAQVFLLGVDPSGKSAAYFASLKRVFDSVPPVFDVSPFAMDRQPYSALPHGATFSAGFPLKSPRIWR